MIGLTLGVPLSGLFLWLALRDADLHEVWTVLTHIDPLPVALAIISFAGLYLGQAARWRRIVRTRAVSTLACARMVVGGVAVNNVLPGRIGDLLRARWMQVAARIHAGRSLATVFVDRAFDVLALVVFLAVSLPFVASAKWLAYIAVGGVVLLTVIGLVLGGARIYTARRARGRRVHRSLVRRIARDTLEGLAEPIGLRQGTVLVGMSLVAWGMCGLAVWLVGRAVGVELTPVEAIFVTAVVNLGSAIPSSPGFIGTQQWLGVSALGLLGVGTEPALAFAILLHAAWYVPTLLVGGVVVVLQALGAFRSTSAARQSSLQEVPDA